MHPVRLLSRVARKIVMLIIMIVRSWIDSNEVIVLEDLCSLVVSMTLVPVIMTSVCDGVDIIS